MKALHNLQQYFAADLWGDDLHYMRDFIVDDKLSAAQRLNVYRNNFRTSFIDALATIYPVVVQLIGRDFFDFVAEQYLRAHPSRSDNLHNFGFALADFLSSFGAVSQLPYLADVARLEWAYHEVFHAEAASAFEPKALQQFAADSYPDLRFDLGPACRLVHSVYPINRIWMVHHEGHIGEKGVNLDDGPESVLIIRPGLAVELRRLQPSEFIFLSAINGGCNLGEAVEATLAYSREFNLQQLLADFLISGVLTVSQNQACQRCVQNLGQTTEDNGHIQHIGNNQ